MGRAVQSVKQSEKFFPKDNELLVIGHLSADAVRHAGSRHGG